MGLNKPICTITLCDYNKNPICDLYNSISNPMGQAYNISYQVESSGWKTLSFDIPDNIDGQPNFRIEKILGQMLVRINIQGEVDWFIISDNSISHKKYVKSYQCDCDHISRLLKVRGLSLALQNQTGEGNGIGTCKDLLQRILTGTGWSAGVVDTFYQKDGITEKVRTITSNTGTGAYKNIQTLCSTFSAKPTFNGATQTVDIHILNPYAKTQKLITEVDPQKMIQLHYGYGLDGVTRKQSSDNLCTSLSLQGQNSSETGYTTIATMNRIRYHSTATAQLEAGTYKASINDGQYIIYFSVQESIPANTELIFDTFDPASQLYIQQVGEEQSTYIRTKRQNKQGIQFTNYTDEWTVMDEQRKAWTNSIMSFDYFDDVGLLTDAQVQAIAKYNSGYPQAAQEYSACASQVTEDQRILSQMGLTTDDNYVIFRSSDATIGADHKSFTVDLDDQNVYWHTEQLASTTSRWYPGRDQISGSNVDWVYVFHPTYNALGEPIKCSFSKCYVLSSQRDGTSNKFTINLCTGVASDANNGRYCYEFIDGNPQNIAYYGVTERYPTTTPLTNAENEVILIVSKNTSAHTAALESTMDSAFKTIKDNASTIIWQTSTPTLKAQRWWFNPQNQVLKYCNGTYWLDEQELQPTLTSDDYSVYRTKFQTIWKACQSYVRVCSGSARQFTFTAQESLPAGPYGVINHDRITYMQAKTDLNTGDYLKLYAPQDYYKTNVWKAEQGIKNSDGEYDITTLQFASVDKDTNDVLPWVVGVSKQVYSNGLTPPTNKPYYFVTLLPYNQLGYKSIKLVTSQAQYKMTFRSRTVYGGLVYWQAGDTYSRRQSDGTLITGNSNYNKIDCKSYTCVPNSGVTLQSSKIPFVPGSSLQFNVIAYTQNNYQGTQIQIQSSNNILLIGQGTIVYDGQIYSLQKSWITVEQTLLKLYQTDKPALQQAKQEMSQLKNNMTDQLGWIYREGIWNDSTYSEQAIQSFYSDGIDNLKQISKPETQYNVSLMNLYGTDQADYLALGQNPNANWRLIDINDCVHVIDQELGLNFYSYVTKVKRQLDNPAKDSITISQEQTDFGGHSLTDTLSRINQLASQLDAKQSIYQRAGIISSKGQIAADVLNGIMDTAKTKLSASNGTCYSDDRGNMIFEAYDGSSAMTITGSGFMIANGKNDDGTWNWRTFGTGDGFTADLITTGQLQAGKIRIMGTDQFYWDADNIYIFDTTDQNKQMRIGRYDGVNYGIGFTTDGGITWHSAIGFNSVQLSSLNQSSKLKIDDNGIVLKSGTTQAGSGSLKVNSDATIDVQSGGSINITTGGSLNVSAASIHLTGGTTTTLQQKLNDMEEQIEQAASTTGKDGYSQAMVSLYIRSATAPTVPQSNLTYTFSTAMITGTLSGWTQSIPAYNNNQLWQTTCNIASKQATHTITKNMWNQPSCVAKDGQTGQQGQAGVSISNIINYYLTNNLTSGVTRETTGWDTNIQQVSQDKKYLWNYQKIVFSDDTLHYTDPAIIGTFGKQGQQGEQGQTGDEGRGISYITQLYAVTTSQQTKPQQSSWSQTMPVITATNKYLWNRQIITYTSGTPATQTFDSIIAVYGDKGQKGDKGNTGDTGDTGVSIVSIVPIHYLKSTSGQPSLPTVQIMTKTTDVNTWTTVVPPYITGYTYWTCNQNKFSDDTITWQGLRQNQDAKSAAIAASDASDAKSLANTAVQKSTNNAAQIESMNDQLTNQINKVNSDIQTKLSKTQQTIASNYNMIINQNQITNYVSQVVKPAIDDNIGTTQEDFNSFITATKQTANGYSIMSKKMQSLDGTQKQIYAHFNFSTDGLKISASQNSDYWIKIDNTGIFIMYKDTQISAFQKDTLTTPNVQLSSVANSANINYSLRPAPDGGVMFVMD